MAGRAERMVNITATLSIQLIERIDELVRDGKIQSRSHLIREAVRNYLKALDSSTRSGLQAPGFEWVTQPL